MANDGRVYAIANYSASSTDEMTFSAGDQLSVIHKGDDKETLWWWARSRDGSEGYVPQNLLAVSRPYFVIHIPDLLFFRYFDDQVSFSCMGTFSVTFSLVF